MVELHAREVVAAVVPLHMELGHSDKPMVQERQRKNRYFVGWDSLTCAAVVRLVHRPSC